METKNTYRVVKGPKGHPRLDAKGRHLEHILVAERALGKLLPSGAEVHHVDGMKSNNVPTNLVICQDVQYHRLLHERAKAMNACGNPDYRRCFMCGRWDDPSHLTRRNSWHSPYHYKCMAIQARVIRNYQISIASDAEVALLLSQGVVIEEAGSKVEDAEAGQ